MKVASSYLPHLVVQERLLLPGEEWQPRLSGWALIQIRSGSGYWLHERMNQELHTGAVVLLAEHVQGRVRASQLGGLALQFFRVEPEFLTGLVTFGEHRFFETAKSHPELSLQILPPGSPVATGFQDLSAIRNGKGFAYRLNLLRLFAGIFEDPLKKQAPEPEVSVDAKQRLRELLEQTSASDLLHVNFPDLARRMRCTPRHLSRVFREVMGMSFREKQAQLRLAQAGKLLATTESKVVDVALESGYQSLSLFCLMFKRRFGLSPGKWRETQKTRKQRNRRWTLPAVSV
jgi:AraC-like DNA-binding protein